MKFNRAWVFRHCVSDRGAARGGVAAHVRIAVFQVVTIACWIATLEACSKSDHETADAGLGIVTGGGAASSAGGSAPGACLAGTAPDEAGRCTRAESAGGSGGTSPAPPTTFLTTRGRALYYDDQPFRVIGINAFGMAGCETGRAYSDAQMDAFFGSLRPRALTRAWAFEAQGITGVERMVRWAEAHSQLLVLSLADGAGFCNESDGRTGGEGTRKAESWYVDGYKARYLPWLEKVVTRFKDSPAIGMWELINEPSGTTDQIMRAFLDDAAAHVKAIDPNHLVMSGSQAEYVRGTSDFAYVHAGPDIDVASLHEYDYDDSGSRTIVTPHLRPALSAMAKLDKPLLISEVGIDGGMTSDCTDLNTRRDAFKEKLDAYLSREGVVGMMIWSWVPKARSGCFYEAGPDDPIMDLLRTYE